ARCFNKSKGVLITGSKLKAFRNPQPSWGFSVHKKTPAQWQALCSQGITRSDASVALCHIITMRG
ncbi:hypothetical protein ODR35_24440, partial [Escherichia coli]|nr:hypothetical protein [Escherichia coli]